MSITLRKLMLISAAAAAVCCAGCGGGGGGGSTSSPTPSAPLTLSVETPVLTDKVGQNVDIPVKTSGSGAVTTATFDLHFNSGVFESSAVLAANSPSTEVTGLPNDTVCRYKWIDAQTIRVAYASSQGTTGGTDLVKIPVKVLSANSPNITIQQAALNSAN